MVYDTKGPKWICIFKISENPRDVNVENFQKIANKNQFKYLIYLKNVQNCMHIHLNYSKIFVKKYLSILNILQQRALRNYSLLGYYFRLKEELSPPNPQWVLLADWAQRVFPFAPCYCIFKYVIITQKRGLIKLLFSHYICFSIIRIFLSLFFTILIQ